MGVSLFRLGLEVVIWARARKQDLFVSPTNAAITPDATVAITPEFQASGFSQVFLHEALNDHGAALAFDKLRRAIPTTRSRIKSSRQGRRLSVW